MNLQALAAALHALADALVSQSSSETSAPAAAAVATTPAPAPAAAPRPRGRPPKGVEGAPAAATPAAVAAPTAAAAPATAAPTASSLTHADLVPAFKKAALDHGAEFVRGLLKVRNAKTFNDVKDLAQFKTDLEMGPQAATDSVADLIG